MGGELNIPFYTFLPQYLYQTHLNNPTVFTHLTASDIRHPLSPTNSVNGISGRRIDFSCTWNENKKNAIDTADKVWRGRNR
jgi:hypothetical protein